MPTQVNPTAALDAFYRQQQYSQGQRAEQEDSASRRLAQLYAGNQEQRAQSAETRAQGAYDANQQAGQTDARIESIQRVAKIAEQALSYTDPMQRKGFLQHAVPAYSQDFAALGADMNELPQLLAMDDAQLQSELEQVAGLGGPKNADASLVQSAQILANGNIGYLTRDGKLVDTGQKAKEPLQLTEMAGGRGIANLRTQEFSPLSTAEQELAAAAAQAGAVTTAQESARTAAIVPRANAERVAAAPQRAEKLRQITAGVGNTTAMIDKALGDSSKWTAGFIGSMAKAVPGSPAYDLQQTLLTIKANVGFDRLQAMREASPTGGALGQVAVQELQSLQATIASLDQAQSPESLRRNLRSVKTHYENWLDAVKEANSDTGQKQGSETAAERAKRLGL